MNILISDNRVVITFVLTSVCSCHIPITQMTLKPFDLSLVTIAFSDVELEMWTTKDEGCHLFVSGY